MRIPVKFVELASPIFLGANLGSKLEVKNRPELIMNYDTEHNWLIVQYKGLVEVIGVGGWLGWQPIDPNDIGVEVKVIPQAPAKPVNHAQPAHFAPPPMAKTAQVSNPTKPANGLTSLEGAPKFIARPVKPPKAGAGESH